MRGDAQPQPSSARPSSQKSGSIIQINSKSGKKGSAANSAYAASKFGGIGLVCVPWTYFEAIDRVPIGIALSAAAAAYIAIDPLLTTEVIFRAFFNFISRYSLTAIPLFIFAGELMNLWVQMQRIGADKLDSAAIMAAFRGARDEKSFFGHPYTCDGKQMAGYPSMCAPQQTLVSALVSIRNTDLANTIRITSAVYYDTQGKKLREYLPQPVAVPPMGTHEIFVPRADSAGGSGANFVIVW